MTITGPGATGASSPAQPVRPAQTPAPPHAHDVQALQQELKELKRVPLPPVHTKTNAEIKQLKSRLKDLKARAKDIKAHLESSRAEQTRAEEAGNYDRAKFVSHAVYSDSLEYKQVSGEIAYVEGQLNAPAYSIGETLLLNEQNEAQSREGAQRVADVLKATPIQRL